MLTKNVKTWTTGKNTYERLEDKIENAFGKIHYLLEKEEKEEKLDKTIKDNEIIEVAE